MLSTLQFEDWRAAVGVAFFGFFVVGFLGLWVATTVGVVRWLLGAPGSGRELRGASVVVDDGDSEV
jgi:hypothetical protein